MRTLESLMRKSKQLENDYKNANNDIKVMIQNIFNACFRFGLNDTQTIFMIEQALEPIHNDIMLKLI